MIIEGAWGEDWDERKDETKDWDLRIRKLGQDDWRWGEDQGERKDETKDRDLRIRQLGQDHWRLQYD
jgi:hypothetical protein